MNACDVAPLFLILMGGCQPPPAPTYYRPTCIAALFLEIAVLLYPKEEEVKWCDMVVKSFLQHSTSHIFRSSQYAQRWHIFKA